MINDARFMSIRSDAFVGRRTRLERYLVSSLEGYFPVLLRTGDRSLAVVYRSGGTHVSVTGTLSVAVSEDGGRSWSDGVAIRPKWHDVRNPAIGANAAGELVVAYWQAGLNAYRYAEDGSGLEHYSAEEPPREPTLFTVRSADKGRTWSEPAPIVSVPSHFRLASPYGKILTLEDGTMLMSVYGETVPSSDGAEPRDAIIAMRSRDGGLTWDDWSPVADGFNETSFERLPGGRLIAAARAMAGGISILFSDDDGRTWSEPEPLTRAGEHPADATLLRSGKLLLTFGRRVRPFGCGALLSEDLGRTWRHDREILLAGDGIENVDLGYPSTEQLADGTIVTVLYYASGSDASEKFKGWGELSCQAIVYREEDIV